MRAAAVIVIIVTLASLGRLATFDFSTWDDPHTVAQRALDGSPATHP